MNGTQRRSDGHARDKSRLRQAYDTVERAVAPRLEVLVRTGEFANAAALAARAQWLAGKQVSGVTARIWHVANLPAGTDV
jgi:hypothetical protein